MQLWPAKRLIAPYEFYVFAAWHVSWGDGQSHAWRRIISTTSARSALYQDNILLGSGFNCDALPFSRFESKLEQYHGNLDVRGSS